MKCLSRSTFGIFIGSLNVLALIAGFFFGLTVLVKENIKQYPGIGELNRNLGLLLLLCLCLCIISGLLIIGIVKRRDKLMMPWLVITGIAFLVNSGDFVISFIASVFQAQSHISILILLMSGLLRLAISGLILWPIFSLHHDINRENAKKKTLA